MKTKCNSLHSERQPATRPPLGWYVLALFLALGWTGCKQDSNVAADVNPAGIFTLMSVNGKQVPCNLTHEGANMTVKSGVFTISGDGTCSTRTIFSVDSHGDVTREVEATYTRKGTKLTMKWKGAGTTEGDIEGNTFTMNNEDMVLAYQKQPTKD